MERYKNNQELNLENDYDNIKNIPRGIWSNNLYDGDILPVGGHLNSDELDIKLELDFSTFEGELENYNKESFIEFFETGDNKKNYREYLESFGSNFDAFTHFVCFQVQKKVEKLLEIDPVKKTDSQERNYMYENSIPKLSEMRGKSMCSEIAALAQFLIQRIGIESAYMSGKSSSSSSPNSFENHSVVVLKNPENDKFDLIFDVARPRESGTPVIYKTEEDFDYKNLVDEYEKYIKGQEVVDGRVCWFGVDDGLAH